MTDERVVVLSCSSCKSTHHLTVATVVSKEPLAQRTVQEGARHDEQDGEALLKACASTHHASLTLREMDVFHDLVLLRCADCRRQYEATVAVFETRQK
jgi:hypothetical protein